MIYISTFPRWLNLRDVTSALIGWGAYMSYLAVYCLLYTGIVESATIELIAAFVWIVKEWAIWLVLTPLMCAGLRALQGNRKTCRAAMLQYGMLIGGALVTALSYRVTLDVLNGANIAASIINFFPKYAIASVLVVLVWQMLQIRMTENSYSRSSPVTLPVTLDSDFVNPSPDFNRTLLVSTGQHESLITVSEIDLVSASGNYVDIHSKGQVYILRTSLRLLEETLPADHFIRIHRSHLVKRTAIDRIVRTTSGNGVVILHNGLEAPISKKYWALLKQLGSVVRDMPASQSHLHRDSDIRP
jgi:two-component system LytT family response regulator